METIERFPYLQPVSSVWETLPEQVLCASAETEPYDDNGNYKKSVINGENTQLEFTYDKDGKPIMKKNF